MSKLDILNLFIQSKLPKIINLFKYLIKVIFKRYLKRYQHINENYYL